VAKTLRVLVVDDSRVGRTMLGRIVAADPEMTVVGEAEDGGEALRMLPELKPDLVLMDIMMPKVDGLTATEELMRTNPTPVVLISDLSARDVQLNFKALEAGALDILGKPTATEANDPLTRQRLARKLRLLAEVPVVRRRRKSTPSSTPIASPPLATAPSRKVELVCIGASTGGPPAIAGLLKAIGPKAPWPILVVQHMTTGFMGSLAAWLADTTRLSVTIGEPSGPLTPGRVVVAPDFAHLVLTPTGLGLSREPPRRGHRPAVDCLFESVVEAGWASRTIGILLTGMGDDGAAGLRRIRDAGGWTIAQDEASSVVYGMPRAAVELEAACDVLPLDAMPARLAALTAV